LARQLAIEERKTKEKMNQYDLTSDAMKLYEISQKYGVDAAKEIADVLAGNKSIEDLSSGFGGGRTENIFKKEFGDRYQASKANEFFYSGAGREIAIPERPNISSVSAQMPVNIEVSANFENIWERVKSVLKSELDNPSSQVSQAFVKMYSRY
jgi:hypothetical protein